MIKKNVDPIPKSLMHLLEKRDVAARRQHDRRVNNQDEADGEDRRKAERRSKVRRKKP